MTIPAPPPLPAAPAVSEPRTRRPSWWRRNRGALAVIVLVLPALAFGIFGYELYLFYGFGARPYKPVVAEEEGTVDFAGATWGPVKAVHIEDTEGLDVPEGTRLIAVGVTVDVGTEGISCSKPTLTEQSTGRVWLSTRSEIGLLSSSDEPEQCFTDLTGEYQIIVPYVVPEDASGPFWVDVAMLDTDGEFVRFSVEPRPPS